MRWRFRSTVLALAVVVGLLSMSQTLQRWLGSGRVCSVFGTLLGASHGETTPMVPRLRHRPLDAPTLL